MQSGRKRTDSKVPTGANSSEIKLAFASCSADLIDQFVEEIHKMGNTDLPVYVVAEFQPRIICHWIPWHPFEDIRINHQRILWHIAGRAIHFNCIIFQPKQPYWNMRWLAFKIAPAKIYFFNENYGHAGGDRVLRAVAAECRRHLRPGDAIGRLGGEEFAVLLPDSNERAALGCAERLRRGIERLRIGDFRPVTASFGIALVHSSADVDQWLAEADSALFAAKRSGRNRTVIHEPRAAAAA